MTRRVLPQRRRCQTFDLAFGGIAGGYTVTVGFYDNGDIGEVFINGGKSGQQLEAMARDGAVMLSLAIQYGIDLANIKSAITRDDLGAPYSIIGAVVDRLEERSWLVPARSSAAFSANSAGGATSSASESTPAT
jgi:hypothetical protein